MVEGTFSVMPCSRQDKKDPSVKYTTTIITLQNSCWGKIQVPRVHVIGCQKCMDDMITFPVEGHNNVFKKYLYKIHKRHCMDHQ